MSQTERLPLSSLFNLIAACLILLFAVPLMMISEVIKAFEE